MSFDSFSNSYAEARGKFLAAATDAGARSHSYGRDDVKGIEGEHLACDVAVLGPENATRAAERVGAPNRTESNMRVPVFQVFRGLGVFRGIA